MRERLKAVSLFGISRRSATQILRPSQPKNPQFPSLLTSETMARRRQEKNNNNFKWNNAENLFTGTRIIVVLQASSQRQNAPSLLRYCSMLRALFIFTWLNLNAY